ncbi:unnamed protein product [Schistosoma curassoni]|uniref:Uncharacterized protein n=1 Tax=Schistosoma curassoni TaxID=6186 RepID=A0A183JV92_9TREM|nr:unnamed protein product [Schistosoma curassoni]
MQREHVRKSIDESMARHHNQDGRAGLIPSILLQERRKAFIQSAPNPEELTYKMFACGLAKRRKKKVNSY